MKTTKKTTANPPIQAKLADDIVKLIEETAAKHRITLADILGALEVAKFTCFTRHFDIDGY